MLCRMSCFRYTGGHPGACGLFLCLCNILTILEFVDSVYWMFSFGLKNVVWARHMRFRWQEQLRPVFSLVLCSTWLGLSVCMCKYSWGQRGCFPK